jgi:ribosomal protein S12 methylthiotransferase accessory factor YcaO
MPELARPVPLDETWNRIRPLLPGLGVTGVAGVTALDTVAGTACPTTSPQAADLGA